jgi:hypothetical protein
MHSTIAKEGTLFGAKLNFMFIIRAKIGPTSTPKHTKKGIIRIVALQFLERGIKLCTQLGVRLIR